MAKPDFSAQLKKRMTATQQASELQTGDDAYQKIFQKTPAASASRICKLPLDRLGPFFTADIGFKPYPTDKLNAFAEHLRENGLLVRIIVRSVPNSDTYEILAGHNRTAGARLAGWTEIEAEVVEADDARAITIATSTNLLQRQDLTVIERGKAYKALLSAETRQGFRSDLADSTSGDFRPKFSARALVAEFFGVTEYEIRKAVKLTQLIPPLQDILENTPKKLNLACADLIADYDAASQEAFAEMCGIEGYALNKAAVLHITQTCPPPTADRQALFAAYQEARAMAEQRMAAPPKKISFDRKKFAPYLTDIGSDKELEKLFLEFLQSRRT